MTAALENPNCGHEKSGQWPLFSCPHWVISQPPKKITERKLNHETTIRAMVIVRGKFSKLNMLSALC
jgi:hypothetical protein